MPSLPILPGPSLPGLVPAAAPTAPAAAIDPGADPNAGGSFVDQLAAALAALVAPQPATATPQAPADDVLTDTHPEPAHADEDKDKAAQPEADAMLELLASFGLVPMPMTPPVVPPTQVAPTASSDADDQAAPLAATAQTLLAGVLPHVPMPAQAGEAPASPPGISDAAASPSNTPTTSATADAGQTSTPPSDLPTTPDTHTLADPSLLADAARTAVPSATLPSPLAAAATHPSDQRAGAAEPRPALTAIAAAADVRARREPGAPEGTPRRDPVAGATPTAPRAATLQASADASATTQTGQHGQSGHDSSSSRPEVSAADPSSQTAEPASPAMPPPALASIQTNAAATPDAARPRDVVAQIAQQAELYRLPGGRGVRIQLHPDGLGGVEVTVRYGNAGALELHVNVEHAATGALVQAGWTDLRDALAQQGISPDRLVMSVSGPQGGGLSSDSGSFGSGSGFSFRSDAGPMGFGQSSQGQQDRQPASGARVPWAPSVDAPPQEEIATPASSSRIDLRV